MDLKKFARDHYRIYAAVPGSEYIVSEFGLYNILKLVEKYECKNILEIGLGIGTIAAGILKYSARKKLEINYTGTENNNFCLDQLAKNLMPYQSHFNIYNSINEIPSSTKYDLIIIDGLDPSLKTIKEKLNPEGIIIIEGDRAGQTSLIRKSFPASLFSPRVSILKNKSYSYRDLKEFQTGIKVIYPYPNLQQKFDWAIMKILMKFRYFKRDYLS